jgi:hypothetical protein
LASGQPLLHHWGVWHIRIDASREARVQLIPVQSSAVEAVGYDPPTRRLRIRFTSGREYDFCGVPESVYRGLISAPSKGAYYNDHIKDRYPC